MKIEPYFITGLPRSRTAWCAAFFTGFYNQVCYHEGLRGTKSLDEFTQRMYLSGYSKVGNSDCGMALFDFQAAFPDSPVLIIRRPFVDVCRSLAAMDIPIEAQMVHVIDRRLNHVDGLEVGFDELDHRMPEVCKHLGLPYSEQRHEQFMQLNIQTTNYGPDQDALEWVMNHR